MKVKLWSTDEWLELKAEYSVWMRSQDMGLWSVDLDKNETQTINAVTGKFSELYKREETVDLLSRTPGYFSLTLFNQSIIASEVRFDGPNSIKAIKAASGVPTSLIIPTSSKPLNWGFLSFEAGKLKSGTLSGHSEVTLPGTSKPFQLSKLKFEDNYKVKPLELTHKVEANYNGVQILYSKPGATQYCKSLKYDGGDADYGGTHTTVYFNGYKTFFDPQKDDFVDLGEGKAEVIDKLFCYVKRSFSLDDIIQKTF